MAKQWVNEYAKTIANKYQNGVTDGEVLLDIKVGIIRNLKHDGIFMHGTNQEYNISGIGAGVISLQQAAMLKIGSYSYTGDNKAQTISVRQVDIKCNTVLSVFFESEDLDLSSLNRSATLTAQTTGSLSSSLAAFMDCEDIDLSVTTALLRGHVIELDLNSTSMTSENFKDIWQTIADESIRFKQYFTAFDLGTNVSEILVYVAPKLSNRILRAFATVIGTESAFKSLQLPNANNFKLNGLNIVEHVFLDTNIEDLSKPNQTYFTDLRAYDFRGILFVMKHQAATTLPMGIQRIKGVINKDTGNDRLIAKYKYGKGTIYPDLVTVGLQKTTAKYNQAFNLDLNATPNELRFRLHQNIIDPQLTSLSEWIGTNQLAFTFAKKRADVDETKSTLTFEELSSLAQYQYTDLKNNQNKEIYAVIHKNNMKASDTSTYMIIPFKVVDINASNATNFYSANHPVGRMANMLKKGTYDSVKTGVMNGNLNNVLADGQEEDFQRAKDAGIKTQQGLLNISKDDNDKG